MKIVGERFRQAREQLGLSVESLAKKTTYSTRQIQQIEGGEHSAFYSEVIKLQCAKKIATILDLSYKEAFEALQAVVEPAPSPNTVIAGLQSPLPIASDLLEQQRPAESSTLKMQLPMPSRMESQPNTIRAVKFWTLSLVFPIFLLGAGWAVFAPTLEADEPILLGWPPTQLSGEGKVRTEVESIVNQLPEPKPVLAASVVSPAQSHSTSCALSASSTLLEYKPVKASKIGNQVYILNKGEAQAICFEDATGRVERVTVLSNEGFNFTGKPPLKIISKNLNLLDIFYQGYKVKEGMLSQAILLQETDIP